MSRHAKGGLRKRGQRHPEWVWRRREQGREREISLGPVSAMSERQARAEIERRWLLEHPDGESGGMLATLNALWPLYQADCLPAMKISSRDTCRSLITKHALPVLGDLPLLNIDAQRLQDWVWQLNDQQLARGSIQVALRYLRVVLEYGRQKRHFAVRPWPARGWIKLPPKVVTTPKRCFTPAECARVLAACDLRLRCLFGIAAVLGVRCNEVLGLPWRNVDLAARMIRIRQGAVKRYIQSVKSETSNRDLPISDELHAVLVAWRAAWTPNADDLLFVNEHGLPMTNREAIALLSPILDRLGIPHGGIHAFRHGVATEMGRTASIKTVQGAFGHAKVETTLGYTGDITSDRVDAVAAQSRKVFGDALSESSRGELGHDTP